MLGFETMCNGESSWRTPFNIVAAFLLFTFAGTRDTPAQAANPETGNPARQASDANFPAKQESFSDNFETPASRGAAYQVRSFASPARNYYGAIAYSPATQSLGTALNYESSAKAEETAKLDCQRSNRRKVAEEGSSECTALVSFRNACGALAVGPDGTSFALAWGESRPYAETLARKNCDGRAKTACSVRHSVCTLH